MHRDDNGNARWDLARLRLDEADAERNAWLRERIAKDEQPRQCRDCGEEIRTLPGVVRCRACANRERMRLKRRAERALKHLRLAMKARQRPDYVARRAEEKRQRDIERARRKLAARGIVT